MSPGPGKPALATLQIHPDIVAFIITMVLFTIVLSCFFVWILRRVEDLHHQLTSYRRELARDDAEDLLDRQGRELLNQPICPLCQMALEGDEGKPRLYVIKDHPHN